LKSGSYARARVPTNKTERIMIVPARAVAYVLGSNKAFVIKGELIEARDVRVGDRFGESLEIIEGLREGEQVALGPLARLDTGVQVRITGTEETELPAAGRKESE
jgi:hypothetical protein